MKKLISIIIVIVAGNILIYVHKSTRVVMVNDREADIESLKEGTYTGTGKGFIDDIVVEVMFEKRNFNVVPNMTRITIIKADEVEKYWAKVREKIISEVLKEQNININSVTGATKSGHGLLEAIQDARKRAHKRD